MTKIVVTQQHIDLGKRKCPGECPVALAAQDAGYHRPSVWLRSMSFVKDLNRQFGFLPNIVTQFIQDYDEGKVVGPMEFELLYETNNNTNTLT